MRALLALVICVLASPPSSAQGSRRLRRSYGEAVFVVSGRGWGHGVGMSQYGAYGQALAGRTYDQILAHYYTGTTIGKAGRKEVRVLLAEGRRAVTISSTAPFTRSRCDRRDLQAPDGRADAALGSRAAAEGGSGRRRSHAARHPARQEGGPRARRPPYRGKLELVPQGEFLRVVNVVALESYLQGVVAGEVPFSWPAEALKAQAVAARSYALANLVKGKPFDLYSDVRSQVYLGVRGREVLDDEGGYGTAGEVVLYGGKVATTYYFSTSGGKTASAADVFGFDVPYLVSRPDPWDKASPYHRWGPVLLGARTVQAKLGGDRARRRRDGIGDSVRTAPSARPLDDGGLRDVPGLARPNGARPALDVDHGRRAPSRPAVGRHCRAAARPRAWPASSAVSGRRASHPRRTARRGPPGTEVTFDKNGIVTADVTPERTMRYRLEAEGRASPAVLVQVAPRIQLARPSAVDPTTLRGTVRPRLTGAVVAIERRKGTSWVTIGETTVDAGGLLRSTLDAVVPAGAYRARVSATAGYAAGTSPILQVSG